MTSRSNRHPDWRDVTPTKPPALTSRGRSAHHTRWADTLMGIATIWKEKGEAGAARHYISLANKHLKLSERAP